MIDLRRVGQRTKKMIDDGVHLLLNEILLRLKLIKLKIQENIINIEHITVQILFHGGNLSDVIHVCETIWSDQ